MSTLVSTVVPRAARAHVHVHGAPLGDGHHHPAHHPMNTGWHRHWHRHDPVTRTHPQLPDAYHLHRH
jgi:hypothetical protein